MTGTDTIETHPLPDDLCWPGARRIAIVFNVAWEIWRDGTT